VYAAKNGTKQVFGVAESMCGAQVYSFNYSGYVREELLPLILYHGTGVTANLTTGNIDNTIFIWKPQDDPWDPWTALTILRNLEQP
jgi:hypothetical protein